MTRRRTSLALLMLIGLLIRLLRLTWQPLWWDEGYSVYFATEPLGRMVSLTAHDIHPPLYYALLHGWLVTFQSAQPMVLRLFSVLIGLCALPLLAWLAHLLFPTQPRLPWLAMLLLLFNPLHLFYSQEVRMYGLAMLLSMASTAFFWQIIRQSEQKSAKRGVWLGYILTASLALYTLYYLALLLLAHFIWAGWHFRQRLQLFVRLLLADVFVAILYLPWLFYAGPKLVQYIGSKVRSDNDTPLTLFNYLSRHLLAFTAGHIAPANLVIRSLSLTAIAMIALLWIAMQVRSIQAKRTVVMAQVETSTASSAPDFVLWTCLLLPVALAFLLNLRFPFFPEGGERLLLFVLPYFLLLVAAAMDRCWHSWRIGQLALIGFLLSGAIGCWVFYRTPRYDSHDYRPLIQQVVQQGTDTDTVLAIFPWQIGYWRAYAPTVGLSLIHGPQPTLIAEGALTWGAPVQQAIDTALARGTLWFPEPLSFGSSLPGQIENYLAPQGTNLVNQWYSTTTRLTAWNKLATPPLQPQTADFGPVRLIGAGVMPQQVASANQPFVVMLAWQLVDPATRYGVTVRLQDPQGHIWAHRDYAPLGSLSVITETLQPIDQVGFITPVGLPPGAYQLVVGVVDSHEQLLARLQVKQAAQALLAPIAAMTIRQPRQPLPPFRIPIQAPLPQPFVSGGLTLLGYAGYTRGTELLAGSTLDLVLFLQNQAGAGPNRQLYLSLLAKNGAGVAGWQGWSLPDYPTAAWPPSALVQIPVTFDLPATLISGPYQLIAGFINPNNNEKSPAATLDTIQVRQRQADFVRPAMEHALDEPVQFGTHARLIGYDITQADKQLTLRLHWQIVQTLLPAHHIFVHLDSAAGDTLAQDDGPPSTLAGPAPTGSWQPDEYLTTLHQLHLPALIPPHAVLHVGLYIPATGERRPASVQGASIGDMAQLPLQP